MGPAKPDHGGLHLSATRVDGFLKCQRKWAWEYLAGVQVPPSPWLPFGTMFHAVAEDYFELGDLDARRAHDKYKSRIVPLAKILATPLSHPGFAKENIHRARKLFLGSLKHWPKYEPGRFLPERPFSRPVPGGIFTGTCDLPDVWIQRMGDHKTTSDLKWAPSPEELATWPQPIAYSYNTAVELGWKENDCLWVYTEKPTGRTLPVLTPKLPFAYWEDQWNAVFLPATAAMLELHAQGAKPEELPPAKDIDHCDAYGGCFFRDRCSHYQNRNDSALFEGFDGDEEENAMSSELDDLLGTAPEAPEQEVGNTLTQEPPADTSDLDALLNPPPGSAPAPDAPTSKAPAIVDPAPNAATVAQAEASQAAKPPKEAKPKTTRKPKDASAPAATSAQAPATKVPDGLPELPAAAQGAEAAADQAVKHVAQEAPAAAQAPAPVAQFMIPMEAVGGALALLVGIYQEMGQKGAAKEAFGAGAVPTAAAVAELAKRYQGNEYVTRAASLIVTMHAAFGGYGNGG